MGSGGGLKAGVVLYVSGHGYGHATRMAALSKALRAREPGLRLAVRTRAPHWLFPEAECSAADIDPGMLQVDSLGVDLAGSLRAHQAFVRGWDAAVRREAAFLQELRARLVVGDIPPLAFAAAAQAGVTAFAVANFSWDWIADQYGREDPSWSPMARRYAGAYARAQELFRLPLHCELPAFPKARDVPLLVSRSALSRAQARRRLGVPSDDTRPVVLVTFGGYGLKEWRVSACDELRGFVFAGFSPAPRGLAAEWIELAARAPRHEDAVAAADVVLGKPGYGTISECIAHGAALLYLPRIDFPEIPALLAGARRWSRCRELSLADFYAGRWREPLEALLSSPAPPERVGADGAEVIAKALLERL